MLFDFIFVAHSFYIWLAFYMSFFYLDFNGPIRNRSSSVMVSTLRSPRDR